MRPGKNLVLLALTLGLAPVAGAQGLADPTRPPAGLSAGEGEAVPAGGPVLQSVMISPKARTAIISGEVVPLNGTYGSARVVRISENEVVLREGGEEQVLKLYPDVRKTGAAAGEDAGRKPGGGGPDAGAAKR